MGYSSPSVRGGSASAAKGKIEIISVSFIVQPAVAGNNEMQEKEYGENILIWSSTCSQLYLKKITPFIEHVIHRDGIPK
jgi:hypothetical protein